MKSPIGRGPLGSIRRRANFETRELSRTNRAARRARYSPLRRILRGCIDERSIIGFLVVYALLWAAVSGLVIFVGNRWPGIVPIWQSATLAGRLKDISGFLVTAQVGLLAIVSVAIGVVTIIAQGDDRSATNSDIRLYYSEALAYELVASAAAFLVVVGVQLFWPVQYGLHLAGMDSGNLFAKVILTAIHVCWMVFNVLMFSQFLLVTLRFVESKARVRMRRRYTANIIVPEWNRKNLLTAFYSNAPKALLHRDEVQDTPYVTFGYGWGEDGEVEIATNFEEPSELYDVWTAPLSFILRGWARRSTPINRKTSPRNVMGQRIVRLIFRLAPGSILDGEKKWLVRVGGAPLHGWERWAIRRCFRFRDVDHAKDALPTPTELLEQLHENAIAQIDKLAQVGFRAAFFEAIEYHRFLLEIQNTVDESGAPLNFSQIGGFFRAPHEEWVYLYRRVIEKGVEKIDVDDYFIHWLSRIVSNLLPQDASGIPEKIITSLLQIGAYEVVLLERWFTNQTSISSGDGRVRHPLPGSLQRVYTEVVQDFIGGWESPVKSTPEIYNWTEFSKGAPDKYFAALSSSWPFMREHLHHTAYFVGAAVWNDDDEAAQAYRDMLVRWADWLRFDGAGEYFLHHRDLISADFLHLEWTTAEARTAFHRIRPDLPLPSPETVFALAVRNSFSDVITVMAAVVLRLHMNSDFPLAAQVARNLLMRQALNAAGSRLSTGTSRIDPYLAIWETLVRAAASDPQLQGNHKAWLGDVVRRMGDIAGRRMISGRIYSGSGVDGLESVYPALLAMLTALLPGDGANVIETFRSMAQTPAYFADGEAGLDRLQWMIDSLARYLESAKAGEEWQRSVRAVSENAPVAENTARLETLLGAIASAIRAVRLERLTAASVDQAALDRLRDAMEEVIRQKRVPISCFTEFDIQLSDRPIGEPFELRFHTSKGYYVNPPMESQASDFHDHLADDLARTISTRVWQHLWQQPWERVPLSEELGSAGFWTEIFALVERVGPAPAALVPLGLGNRVIAWRYTQSNEAPAGRHIDARDDDANGGLYAGYMGTLDGLNIYNDSGTPDETRLFSRHRLRSLLFHPLPDGHFVDVRFEQGNDPRQSVVIIRYSMSFDWRGDDLILAVAGADDDDE
jgi:hypothetical protein